MSQGTIHAAIALISSATLLLTPPNIIPVQSHADAQAAPEADWKAYFGNLTSQFCD